ncbi:hypothetical protein GCM10008090_28100 [Arenicella chitinivorans]|uniref:Uncharacterized protein n=1 Tax=Arenicella chitinivorans TaxID=1329800 RepID=A0A918RZP8_9GAMM|nr:hypothetical protein [Arenicella chitinivorans]GHA16832.1 hypothetical protein GCM10008090_28100 [Arenicella chitinivorans]
MSSKSKLGYKMGNVIGYAALVGSIVFTATASAQVKTKTAEEFAQYGPEDAYWVFTVTCEDDSEHKVQRKTDGDLWCAKEIEGFCDANRDIAADKVCGDAFGEAYAEQKNTIDAEQAARKQAEAESERKRSEAAAAKQREEQAKQQAAQRAQAEADAKVQRQLSIEEELLKIEQEKLDLRRQELELQERAVQIQELLDQEQG